LALAKNVPKLLGRKVLAGLLRPVGVFDQFPQEDEGLSMKMAICIAGHQRLSNKSAAERLMYEVSKWDFETDIFVAAWDAMDVSSEQSADALLLQKIYNPRRLNLEKFGMIHENHKFKYHFIRKHKEFEAMWYKNRQGDDSYSMFYIIKKCNEIKRIYELENNFRYDIVVRIRPDLSPLNFCEIPKETMQPNTIWFPVNGFNVNGFNMTDNVFFGDSETMDRVCNCYDFMDMYLLREKCVWMNECVLVHHLNKLKIDVRNCDRLHYLIHHHEWYSHHPQSLLML
jgi:hypothetical protein